MEKPEAEVLQDAALKRQSVRKFLDEKNLDGVMITTREHFAWITSGGDSHVVYNSNLGFGTIVITREKAYLVAHSMDAERLLIEQMDGQDYELVVLRWYEGDIREKARLLAGDKVGSDTDFPGTINIYGDLVDLHYPMTDLEVKRVRELAKDTDALYSRFIETIKPGETETSIAARFHAAHLEAGMEADVIIVGSDERCFRYRHPIATSKKLDKYLMLHSAARRWGLHCNLTRYIHFGTPAENIRRIYDAAAAVEARVFQALKPGVHFADILKWQRQWYAEQGYPEEWKNHFQGGPTGYITVDGGRCLTDKVVQINQPYEWFITIAGTKMGELSLMTAAGLEISSFLHSKWPGMDVETAAGAITVPDLQIV